jgi:hypothetical protein
MLASAVLAAGVHVPLKAGDAGHQLDFQASDDHWFPQMKGLAEASP